MSNKAELLEAIAGKNRGLLANEVENVAILSAVSRLEDHNPTPKPVEASELLEGDWRLLYTTSKGILGLSRVPLFQLGQTYQCIRTSAARVYNVAEIVGVPFLEGLVSVAANFKPVSSHRVDVEFQRSIIGFQRFLGYRSVGEFIKRIETGNKFLAIDFEIGDRDQQGWLETTYLDEDLRIGRGNEGSIFVLAKEKR